VFQVVVSILRLGQNVLQITACRLFSVDAALMFSVGVSKIKKPFKSTILDLWRCVFVSFYNDPVRCCQ
jgi:hypothetical protein